MSMANLIHHVPSSKKPDPIVGSMPGTRARKAKSGWKAVWSVMGAKNSRDDEVYRERGEFCSDRVGASAASFMLMLFSSLRATPSFEYCKIHFNFSAVLGISFPATTVLKRR